MKRRIYWLLPDLESARRTMDDLLLARIDYRHIHFVAREDRNMAGLHAANLLQTSDVVRSAEMGLVSAPRRAPSWACSRRCTTRSSATSRSGAWRLAWPSAAGCSGPGRRA